MPEKEKLNPQPLPPGSISFEQFTESVTASVLRAIQSHVEATANPEWKNPRIIIGVVAEPKLEAALQVK